MSSAAVEVIQKPVEEIARDIDSDFQFVADRLPTEVKLAYAGKVFTLATLEGLGSMWAQYGGRKLNEAEESGAQLVVRIGMKIDTEQSRFGYCKEYELTDQTAAVEGPLIDLRPTSAELLMSCPAPVSELALAAESFRKEFTRIRSENKVSTEEVAQLDAFRTS